MKPKQICVLSLLPTCPPKFVPIILSKLCLRDLPQECYTWPSPGLKLLTQPGSVHLSSSVSHHISPSPRRLSHAGQKEVTTQYARCWIGCYFSRPTGPDPARGGGGGSGDRTCRAGWGGQNFPVFYPFATCSPIERNGTLRANRRGRPGSGPPARPQESCPLGEEKERALETNGETEGARAHVSKHGYIT